MQSTKPADINNIRLEPVTDSRDILRFMRPQDVPVHPFEPLTCTNNIFHDGQVLPQPNCKLSMRQLKRTIGSYIAIYKQPRSANRTYLLERIRSFAAENNARLPEPWEMRQNKLKKRIVLESVAKSLSDGVYEFKAYFDGENFVGYVPTHRISKHDEYPITHWDELFDMEYPLLKGLPENDEKGKTKVAVQEIRAHIESELIRRFYDVYGYDDATETEPCFCFIRRKLWNLTAAYNGRRKRFFRKKDQMKWTAWWTITYDNSKFASEEEFKEKLLTKFRNFAYQKDWRIMGVFERGEENDRLHFHGFFYIPHGKEVGQLAHRAHKSDKDGQWHNYITNTWFEENYGINEYEDIEYISEAGKANLAKYTSKMVNYMNKGYKVFYSRHIPSDFSILLRADEIMTVMKTRMKRTVSRCVIWDDAIIRTSTALVRATPIEPPVPPAPPAPPKNLFELMRRQEQVA